MSQCSGSSGFKRKGKNGLIYKMEIDPKPRNKLMVTKVEGADKLGVGFNRCMLLYI